MKKISKILMALTAAPLLASCGAKAQFKNISYERVLNNNEKAALMAKVSAATYEKINKMKLETSSKTKTDLNSMDATAKQDIEFFTNGEAQAVGQRKETNKVDGKVVEVKEKVTTTFAKYDETHFAMFTESDQDKFNYQQGLLPEGYESTSVKYELDDLFIMLSATGVPGQFFAVENKKGEQFLLSSQEEETYTPVLYGSDTKVLHEIHQAQSVAYFNKDFSLKSVTMYDVRKTNRDPDTGKFSSSPKLYTERKETYTFSYGSRADGSSKVGSYRETAKNGWYLGNLALSGKLLKADATQIGSIGFTKVLEERKDYSTKHYVFQTAQVPPMVGDVAVDQLKLEINGSSVKNSATDPVAITNAEVLVGNLVAGYSGMTLSSGKLKMGKADAVLTIEFDAVANDTGALLSNVVAYAEMYYEA